MMADKKVLTRVLATAIVIIAFSFVANDLHSSWDSLADNISSPSLSFWAGCVLILSMMALWPAVWIIIMRGCGVKMPTKNAYAIWWVSNLGKYVPGKVTLIAGRAWLARRWGPQVVLESFAWEFYNSPNQRAIQPPICVDGSPRQISYKRRPACGPTPHPANQRPTLAPLRRSP